MCVGIVTALALGTMLTGCTEDRSDLCNKQHRAGCGSCDKKDDHEGHHVCNECGAMYD